MTDALFKARFCRENTLAVILSKAKDLTINATRSMVTEHRVTHEVPPFARNDTRPMAWQLFERVEKSVGAAEVDDTVGDKRRREDRADVELAIGRNDGGLAP